MSYWFIQSETLGKLSMGRQANAAKSVAMFTDQSGTQIIDNYTFLAGFPQFYVRSGGDLIPAVIWGSSHSATSKAFPSAETATASVMNGVRYDTPAIAGFTASASWGEDDFWEVALRYSGEFSGFKVVLGAGYSEFTDENVVGPLPVGTVKHSDFFRPAAMFNISKPVCSSTPPTGMRTTDTRIGVAQLQPENGEHWYLKEASAENGTGRSAPPSSTATMRLSGSDWPCGTLLGVTDSTLRRYGGGIAQEI